MSIEAIFNAFSAAKEKKERKVGEQQKYIHRNTYILEFYFYSCQFNF